MKPEDLRLALDIALVAANEANKIIHMCYAERSARSHTDKYDNNEFLKVEEKTEAIDLVTKYDIMVEEAIIKILKGKSPEHYQFICEEANPNAPLTDAPTWIIDPIDGTMSFVHGSFDMCVSIGLSYQKKPILGVICCPFINGYDAAYQGEEDNSQTIMHPTISPINVLQKGEILYGVKGFGAYCNGIKLPDLSKGKLSQTDSSNALVCFNMPWHASTEGVEAALEIRRELATVKMVHGIRSFGSGVFQLAQVALGRADAYMECGGKIWDICAAAAIIEAAGGTVLEAEGGQFDISNGDYSFTVACTEWLAKEMGELCKRKNYKRRYWSKNVSS
eukprot:Tbor_TRINITY_DN4676_c0_g1::TRINITY_DN4676_c0_g1_i1::g.14941::m.14941/K01092/E3.1.3.25, IMPA, suhB; myo-inositol-1(or 4)-monophosphatase